jgi:DNA-binding transcriptional MocR family regulator
MKRYEQLVELLAADIRTGRLAPGTRLPSIRTITAQHGLSASTAFKAYYRLEEKGLVRAQPRSGYYVTASAMQQLAAPARGAADGKAGKARRPGWRRVRTSANWCSRCWARRRTRPSFRWARPSRRRGCSRCSGWASRWPAARVLSRGRTRWPACRAATKGLRRQIALRYLAMGMAQPAEELIVTHGALEALNLCLTAVAQPGDLVAVESPGFYASLQALERLKMKALEIPVHPQDGLDLAALADALQRHPVKACWFMTSFPEPHGRQPVAGEKESAGRAAGRPRHSADRRRRVCRAVFRPAAAFCPPRPLTARAW